MKLLEITLYRHSIVLSYNYYSITGAYKIIIIIDRAMQYM